MSRILLLGLATPQGLAGGAPVRRVSGQVPPLLWSGGLDGLGLRKPRVGQWDPKDGPEPSS